MRLARGNAVGAVPVSYTHLRGKVAFKEIDGLTIENRAAHMKAIPADVLAELKACHVILKGHTTTRCVYETG